MIPPTGIFIEDYDYDLPEEQIAQHPLEQRDASKLLVWKDGIISEDVFSRLHNHLPDYSLMIFNDTRVIRARLLFRKATGGLIEIFCLEPADQDDEPEISLRREGSVVWNCLIGNAKRWRSGKVMKELSVSGNEIKLYAEIREKLQDGCFETEFTWKPGSVTFREILDHAGAVPLPPYIRRAPVNDDALQYQTIYASHDGSVAAPTAGLHFTDSVMGNLRQKNINPEKVTLHVGLGTFRPVNENDIARHIMHHEKISVSRETILTLIKSSDRHVIAVGTTSVRTIESLYWIGVKLMSGTCGEIPGISQWDPYDERLDQHIPAEEALEALADALAANNLDHYHGSTQLMIVPGYRFRIISGMVTNFHLPKSTLLLLVSAFAGTDWKRAYDFALSNRFRFLSYGDACLFLKTKI